MTRVILSFMCQGDSKKLQSFLPVADISNVNNPRRSSFNFSKVASSTWVPKCGSQWLQIIGFFLLAAATYRYDAT